MLFYRGHTDKKVQNMTQSLHPAAQQGFSSAAELYQQARPDYPAAITPWLQQHLNLSEHARLLDLGAGTGKFLNYIQPLSQHITAVEPVAERLAELQKKHPHIETLAARSDNIPLNNQSIHAVFCAQSFHWFANRETLHEIARVLKPEGYLVLIWNQRDISVDWVNALANIVNALEGDTPRYHSGEWRKAFEQQTTFQLSAETTFKQPHQGTVEQVVSNRLLSTSFIAALPSAEQQRLKQQFEQIVEQYTEKSAHDDIVFPYITHVYVFKKIS